VVLGDGVETRPEHFEVEVRVQWLCAGAVEFYARGGGGGLGCRRS
jgi:hypothetical protein